MSKSTQKRASVTTFNRLHAQREQEQSVRLCQKAKNFVGATLEEANAISVDWGSWTPHSPLC